MDFGTSLKATHVRAHPCLWQCKCYFHFLSSTYPKEQPKCKIRVQGQKSTMSAKFFSRLMEYFNKKLGMINFVAIQTLRLGNVNKYLLKSLLQFLKLSPFDLLFVVQVIGQRQSRIVAKVFKDEKELKQNIDIRVNIK